MNLKIKKQNPYTYLSYILKHKSVNTYHFETETTKYVFNRALIVRLFNFRV